MINLGQDLRMRFLIKKKNWGIGMILTMKYFDFWKHLKCFNYRNYKNIHPLSPEVWNELYFF
jgi:hypothetical protein